jgi:AcrR family transcriptional regulator
MLDEQRLTGSSARRERGRKEMQAAILEAAGSIVATEGIDGLTIRAVAQALSYSPAALYEYFDSKEAILAALYFGGADGLGAQCERAVVEISRGASSVDALLALGHAYRSYALNHAELYRLVFGGFKTPPEPPAMECPEENPGCFDTLIQVANRVRGLGGRARLCLTGGKWTPLRRRTPGHASIIACRGATPSRSALQCGGADGDLRLRDRHLSIP